MIATEYVFCALLLYVISYAYYLVISHGLGNKATYLQLRRYIPCALLAVLPATLTHLPLTDPLFVIPSIIWLLWIFTYPTLYYISNHKVSSDFEFHFEAVFGLYMIAWFSGIGLLAKHFSFLGIPAAIFITLGEFLLLAIPAAQLVYYALYRACINENGMQMLQETHYNEIIEFIKSMPWYINLGCFGGTLASFVAIAYANYTTLFIPVTMDLLSLGIILALVIFLSIYIWKKKHGVFIRTAIVEFYLDMQEYREKNKHYLDNLAERYAALEVKPLATPFAKPSTILLVIGESESRDYMQAFAPAYKYATTPWLSSQKENDNFILFPHAYSIIGNTVLAVSNALTEMNQYNNKEFASSCSIIDIAHKLDYKVHWYSNQGHLGCADTPITIMADTADVAKWTKQELNEVQYDESLLQYLDEVDPAKNNFLVVHLKGSHFNFLNRYPEAFTKFGTPGKYDLEPNYANTVAYTDYVLGQIFNYCREKLNLQAMVYFSDHGTLPDRRRSPNYEGIGSLRIPLFTYFSDEYISKNPAIVSTLRQHKEHYWTNDLAYELLCSVLNVESNRFDESNSLASPKFKFKREDLLVDNGRMKIPASNQ